MLQVTQHSINQKKSQSEVGKNSIALSAPEQRDISSNMVKSDTSEQIIEKDPESNNSNIKSGIVKEETVIISVVTTAPLANPKLKNENWFKKEIKPTKSLDLEDQRRDVEHILNLTKPLCTNNKEKNILSDPEMTKDMVIRFVKTHDLSLFIFILHLNNDPIYTLIQLVKMYPIKIRHKMETQFFGLLFIEE